MIVKEMPKIFNVTGARSFSAQVFSAPRFKTIVCRSLRVRGKGFKTLASKMSLSVTKRIVDGP